ncbi:hypothetical protein [Hyphomonas oceanitis]|uniref:hypothetical protein n=1 Tax=Hyphomonas oceanitis TaxID=81033 RepID=UPI003001CCE4
MNLGLTLIGALLFLAPGLAIVLVASLDAPRFVKKPLLGSSSIAILGLVPVLSAVVHGVAMFIGAINRSLAKSHPLLHLPFDFDPYPVYLNLVAGRASGEIETAWALLCIGLITVSSASAYYLITLLFNVRNRRKYGVDARWPNETELEHLYRRATDDERRAIVATVFVKKPVTGAIGGWVGPIDQIYVDQTGAVISVTLLTPALFRLSATQTDLTIDPGAVEYEEVDWTLRYSALTIPASEIESIAYFLTEPPIGADADMTLEDLTVQALGQSSE